MNKVNCAVCNKEEYVSNSRNKNYKTCSRTCFSIFKKSQTVNNAVCTECKKEFHIKPSQKSRFCRTMGIFCSTKCSTAFKKSFYLGEKNPNYRGRLIDSGGYSIVYTLKYGRLKAHQAVAFDILGINKIPKGYCIHHRDTMTINNSPENLCFLSGSDHAWLHKQYGNATLYAFMNNKIDLESLIDWSTDKEKAKRLLPLNLLNQRGVVKLDELLENPEEDNQQPS